ncbi:hypothetical protein L3Y34_005047 [Caenorhabditis briggsae]|uniref:DUF7778 domain-containing protein n=1 Tax=Caenorhabditis briggsae TaxID=6238 RepID=A0AAE9AIY0_CAEBR|nr:hypothetical protein L3Y34_005047 [Caenorhabditis briggsae]
MQVLIQRKPINQKLNKMIPLPNVIEWRVNPDDVLHRGRVMCMFRTKHAFFPDDISSLKMRMTTVTKSGDMIVYDSKDKGLIVNLRDATHVLTDCDKYKATKMKYSRSHIKIKMPRGNIHLFVRDESIYKWTSAILEAHVTTRPKPYVIIRKGGLNITQPKQEVITAIEHLDAPMSPSPSSSGLITVIERPTTSEDTAIPSIRHGDVPVNTLRCKIEKEILMNPKVETLKQPITSEKKSSEKKTPMEEKNFTSYFVFHEGGIRAHAASIQVKTEPLDEENQVILNVERKDEESNGSVKKDWWMRSLKC